MFKIYKLFLSMVISLPLLAQINPIHPVTSLDPMLNENSGMIEYNNYLYFINDSGNENILYEVKASTGLVERELTVINTVNRDWEDLAEDTDNFYIADIGNNSGNRATYSIYKIRKENISYDWLEPETINFSYEDYPNEVQEYQNHNFDAESICVIEDNIYIFTKNWQNQQTNVYTIPNTEGNHVATKVAEYNVDGLITSSAYNSSANTVVLSGYSNTLTPFLVIISDFVHGSTHASEIEKIDISNEVGNFYQIESVTFNVNGEILFSNEDFQTTYLGVDIHVEPMVYETSLSTLGKEEVEAPSKSSVTVYPNPAKDYIDISVGSSNDDIKAYSIYTYDGVLLKNNSYDRRPIYVEDLKSGVYFIVIHTSDNNYKIKFIKQ